MIRLEGIPVIETARLRLRGPRLEDYEAYATFMASGRSIYVGGPLGRLQAWRGFCHVTGHWVYRGFSTFIIADRNTDAALGMCGPWFPEGWPEPEIGWTIWSAENEGKGLAFEAVTAARRFAYDVLGWTTAISMIDHGNDRSAALAARLGAVYETDYTDDTLGTCRIFRHPGPGALA